MIILVFVFGSICHIWENIYDICLSEPVLVYLKWCSSVPFNLKMKKFILLYALVVLHYLYIYLFYFIFIFYCYYCCARLGYICSITKVLTIYQIYHTWIHLLHHCLSSHLPNSWNSFNRYHFCIYIHVYTLLHDIYPPTPFPHHFTPPFLNWRASVLFP
jgi:hypothetical protein